MITRTALTVAAAAAAIGLSVMVAVINPSGPAASPLRPVGSVQQLPLALPVGNARQALTVVAASAHAATAELQAWERRGRGWIRVGPEAVAHVASGGVTTAPHENVPATPIGSYSLTQAFGKMPDPGTAMPYFQVTAADWWISQPGHLYNTHQVCSTACPFHLATPNTQLVSARRAYNYAVVIDYNRSPVRQGAGSAYFLHVTTAGKPTRGCISTVTSAMVAILRWLRPDAHPRILIGIA